MQYVAMDIWRPYRGATRAVLPQAAIVIDKFHVVRMANETVESARKAIRADLTTNQRRGLMHNRFVLLKRERDNNTGTADRGRRNPTRFNHEIRMLKSA
ncbi:transposase TnpA, ISL3 family protein [Pandoraea thiooxydans]|nr:transposase TnpA, ISL3 family protein [Pandoraea thiooxydans]